MRETILAFITKVFHSTEGTYALDVAEASASSAHNNIYEAGAVVNLKKETTILSSHSR